MEPLILLVEDNPDIIKYIKITLEFNECRVITAENGKKGLEVLSELNEYPDLIISDIMMPEMNGYDFFNAVSDDPDLCHVPFIFLSALDSPEDIRFGKILGVDDYLTKPINEDDFLAVVFGKIKRNKQNQLISKRINEIYSTYEIGKDEIPEDLKDRIILIVVVWDDTIGPKVIQQFPKIKTEYPIDSLGDQLYNASKTLYGQDQIKTAGGQLIEVQNFRIMSYIFFDSYPDKSNRGGAQDFMLSLIAPKISYFQSLKLKHIFTELSTLIKRKEKWNIEAYWNTLFELLTKDLRISFKPYKGDNPFVFVCYAHSDKLEVYPIIDYLNKSGFNVWYDEQIAVSDDWKKSIVDNIDKCMAFLVFITPYILDSKYIRKEISYAIDIDKPFYSVYLSDTKLPNDLKFEISGIQSLKKYTMTDDEFYTKIKDKLSPLLGSTK